MSRKKIERLESWFSRCAAEFVAEHFNVPGTLITVSRVVAEPNLTGVKIMITVYPETKEREVAAMLGNYAPQFYEYAKKSYRMKKLPRFEFEIDSGEKNALRIEEILAKEKLKNLKIKKRKKTAW